MGESSPPFHPGFVGRMFAEAGSHYVVDSPYARQSPGVWVEASLAQQLFGTGAGVVAPAETPKGLGNALRGLIHVVAVPKDHSWKVYKPRRTGSVTEYGELVGTCKPPISVSIGACGCQ